MKKRLWVFASLAVMLVSIGVLLFLALKKPEAAGSVEVATDTPPPAPQVRLVAPIYTSGPLSQLPPDEQQLAKAMRDRFGDKLDQPYWRIRVIETLTKMLQKKYPNDWQARLRDLLRQIFPEHAEALLATLEAYDSYSDWLKLSQGKLVYASLEERRKALWDKRVQFFGKDAYVIWEQDLKQEKVADALRKIDQSGLPVSHKVDSYVQTLATVYGQDALNPEQSHPVQLMEGFLKLGSVQEDLHRQTPEQQRQVLRELRSKLGLKEDALERLEVLDEQRTQRFSSGESYMAQRAALEKQYQGQTLQLQLNALQNKLFGEGEAQLLRNEEASGYYRYKERQVIGVN